MSDNIFQWIINGRTIQYSLLNSVRNQTCQTDREFSVHFVHFCTDGNTANITSVWTPCSAEVLEVALKCGSKLSFSELVEFETTISK